MYGLGPSGFSLKRLADIRQDIRQQLELAFGQSFDTSGGSVSGVIIGVIAKGLADAWSELQSVSDSRNPATATGESLLDLGARLGLYPKQSEPLVTTAIDLVYTGAGMYTLAAGALIEVLYDDVSLTLELEQDVDMLSGIVTKGIWRATENGRHTIPANAINETIVGQVQATNTVDIVGGSDDESEDDFRLRVVTVHGQTGAGTDEAIAAHLSALSFIQQARVTSNRTMQTMANGQPPKSFRAVVLPIGYNDLTGDQEQTIVKTISNVHTSGIESWGQRGGLHIDDQGVQEFIRFDTAGIVDAYVRVHIEGNPNVNAIKQAIVNNAGQPRIGEAIKASKLICGIANMEGIDDVAITVSINGASWGFSIPIESDQVARYLPANVSVVEGM